MDRKRGYFGFEIKHEAEKKFPHALLRVPQTEEEVKDGDQVNQVNTKVEIIWSIGLRNSVEQLVEQQINADEFILRNCLRAENVLKEKTWQEPPRHCKV